MSTTSWAMERQNGLRSGALPLTALALFGLWAGLLALSLWVRPLWPVDETRYASVAWEMWRDGWLWVPHLNGEPYSDKPPLLFWLIHLVWSLTGVQVWGARLVPPVFALGTVALTTRLGRVLWPGRPVGERAAVMLAGGVFWSFFATVLMFDMILAFWAVLGVLGLAMAARGRPLGWLWVAIALGLGAWTKGPVIALHLLPAALGYVVWRPAGGPTGRQWAGGLVLSVTAGALIAVAWAGPAAFFGGEAYRNAIFWGQSAGRLREAFAHARPLWWYLPLLPLITLPWSLWPAAWRALLHRDGDHGRRLCALWGVSGLLAFSFISGKQVHYLIPLLPALMLLVASRLPERPPSRAWGLAALWFAVALVLAVTPWMADHEQVDATWLRQIDWRWSLVALAAAVVTLTIQPRHLPAALWQQAIGGAAVSALLLAAVVRVAAPHYDGEAIGKSIAALQRSGHPVAFVGNYHGQFGALGRLPLPVRELDADAVTAWTASHRDGWLVVYDDRSPAHWQAAAIIDRPYRGRRVLLVPAQAAAP